MKEKNVKFIDSIVEMIVNRFIYVNLEIAQFIACQSALETAYGQSRIYFENHNLFGMRVPKVRLSNCVGEKYGHAVYSDYLCSLYDFFYWLQFNGFSQKDLFGKYEAYVKKFRSSPFNPSPHYVDLIISILTNYKIQKNGN